MGWSRTVSYTHLEFDYGMARAKAVLREADFPYVSCNWVDLRTGFNLSLIHISRRCRW